MKIISWDWKEQPPWNKINEAIKEFRCPAITKVHTDSDEYAVVVSSFEAVAKDRSAPQGFWNENKFNYQHHV